MRAPEKNWTLQTLFPALKIAIFRRIAPSCVFLSEYKMKAPEKNLDPHFILSHPISLYFILFLFRFDEGQKVERAGGCPASSDLLLTSSIVQFVSPNLVSAAEDQNEDGG